MKIFSAARHVKWKLSVFPPKADPRAENVNLVSKPGYLGVSYHVAGKADFDVEIDIPGKFQRV